MILGESMNCQTRQSQFFELALSIFLAFQYLKIKSNKEIWLSA